MTEPFYRDSDPHVGTTIAGQYRIEELIARGGMGRVYRATQLALEREVALKVLDLGDLVRRGSDDEIVEDFRQRFVREAASAAKLTHPNTIVIHDYGSEGPLLYMAMELLDGETLAERIDNGGPMAPEDAVRVLTQVCGSLAEAHGRGMVHRDLKPSNIMLVARGSTRDYAKVLDFGLVKQEDDHGLTQSGALIGTPRYMSPEQVAGQAITAASDVYALGACLYHVLSGQPPFDSESKYVLMAAHMNVTPSPIAEVCPEAVVPEALEAVAMRCLLKEPTERYESMEQVAFAMEEAMGDDFTLSGSRALLPSTPRPLGKVPSGEFTAALLDTGASLPNAHVSNRAPEGQSMRYAVLIGILAILVAIALVFLSSSDRRGDEGPPRVIPAADVGDAGALTTPPDASGSRPEATADPTVPPASAVSAPVRVITEPEGARVMVGERDFGNAPAMIPLLAGESAEVELSLEGYETRTVTLTGGQIQTTVRLEREANTRRRQSTRRTSPSETTSETSMETDTSTSGTGGGRQTDNRNPWE